MLTMNTDQLDLYKREIGLIKKENELLQEKTYHLKSKKI